MNHYQKQQFEDQECSSGCESGWTLYLDHSSSLSAYDHQENCGATYLQNGVVSTESKGLKNQEEQEEEDDEDMSMVSDASSGPPHLHEDTNVFFYHTPIDGPLSRNALNKNKNKMEHRRRRRGGNSQDQSFLLDDTASSPFLGFSNKTRSQQPSVVKNVLEYSLGYSTTQFEVRQPPYQEHYDFFHSAPSENQMQQNQWLEGKGW